MDVKAAVLIVSICVLGAVGATRISKRDVDLNPTISTTPDDEFIKFQQAVAEKQEELNTPVIFSDLDAYKSAFDSFKSGDSDAVAGQTAAVNADPNFAKFQKFMVNNMRQYSNFDEFQTRLGLFLNVAKKMGGYNYGGDDLAGINNLSDKTLAEKQGLYG